MRLLLFGGENAVGVGEYRNSIRHRLAMRIEGKRKSGSNGYLKRCIPRRNGGRRRRGYLNPGGRPSTPRLAHISDNCAPFANSREYDPHSRYEVLNALLGEILIQAGASRGEREAAVSPALSSSFSLVNEIDNVFISPATPSMYFRRSRRVAFAGRRRYEFIFPGQ